ncbi:solute carrier family 35 member F1-like [Fagus crenata]
MQNYLNVGKQCSSRLVGGLRNDAKPAMGASCDGDSDSAEEIRSKLEEMDYTGGTKPLLGDILVIAGTIFFAMSNVGEILAFVGYAVATFMFYSFVPFVLKLSGATMFNLSILTSDMWAVVIRIFFYHQQVDWLYYLAFAMVVVGLIIYSTTEKNFVPVPTIEGGNSNAQYQVLTDECEASRNESLAS